MNEQPQVQTKLPLPSSLIQVGGPIRPVNLRSFDDYYRIARLAAASGMLPRDMNSAERACMVMMHGAEVGLPPMASLERIAIINGRRCIWGDAVPALAMDSGELSEWDEGWRGSPGSDEYEAYCTIKRKKGM